MALLQLGIHLYGCENLREIYLPASLLYIMASTVFRDAENLETIYYAGTEEQWNAIADINSAMSNCDANVVYNYVEPTE